MTDQFERFKKVLRELFMIDDAADLDFGIYRIMHQKQKEIENYLDVDLRQQVTEEISNNSGRERQQLQQEIDHLSRNAIGMGMSPDDVPAIRKKKQQLVALGNNSDLEAEVYNHLATFFNRYYEDGDFVSRRRYKKDAYAIPYEGEEVKLYWANYDQYYIKTSEYLHNYSFRLSDGKQVVFRVVEATQEQNNNKPGNNWIRCFALADGEGQTALKVDDEQMTINFTYELMPKANKLQETLIKQAYEKVVHIIKQQHAEFFHVFDLAPTEKERNRTLLQKHLNSFKARNTFDYFIHKDLNGFLSRELDFYIKNEILFIDDIDSRNASDFLQYLAVVKAVKAVGKTIITFLAGLEDFQKKLWLKKKFVVESNFCITLDRVPEKFYAEIVANDAQREEWVRLFAINDIKSNGMFTEGYAIPLSIEFLKQNPYLVLDTKFFSTEFKHKLTASIDNFDGQCDGLLVNSENFQALQILQEKYAGTIRGTYYDPPYNTKKNEFCFKDTFKHSSWMSMMDDRLALTRNLMEQAGAIMISCDENEITNLRLLGNQVFGDDNYLTDIIWEGGSKNDQKYVSISHEYIVVFLKDKAYLDGTEIRWLERKQGLEKIYAAFEAIQKKYPNDYYQQTKAIKKWYRDLPDSEPAKKQKHFNKAEARGIYFAADISKPENGYYYDVLHPVTGKPCKKPKGGWRFIEETMEQQIADDRVEFGPDETTVPCRKSFLKETEYESPSTVIYLDNRVSTALMKNLFNDKKIFDNPKYYLLIARLLNLIGANDSIYLDMFGGSGTTAHSVIHLNKQDDGHRKYIIGEMADYFNKVTKPRIEKVIYSEDWKDGKPVSRKGISQCFKYITLEQYEDTLNNLVIKEKNRSFFGRYSETYLGYMLDTETRGSLFSVERFEHPFDVTMNITRGNETKETPVDMVETFNYLIGLYVEHQSWPKDGICMVEGKTRQGKKTLVVWRDITKVDSKQLNDFFRRQDINIHDNEYEQIYVNGDNNLENMRRDGDMWRVNLIEEEFKNRMFEDCK